MNKTKISKYLKELREKNGLSRTEAASHLGTIYKSILDWESGVMPSNDSLLELAKLYKVTVDDILECDGQISNEELYEKYPIFKPLNYRIEVDKKVDLYTPYQNSLIIVNNRLKELILLFKKRVLSRNEDYELRFLFNNMCGFSEYYYEHYDNEHKDKYLSFVEMLNDCKRVCKSVPEYYYEVLKYIDIPKYGFSVPYPEYGIPGKDQLKDQQFKTLDDWQKDFYLALVQNSDVVFNPNRTPSCLKDYEERYGEQFDKEIVVKRLIRYFIENGAALNPWLFTYVKKQREEHDVLFTLEQFYLDYQKPIFIHFYNPNDDTDREYKYAHVANNDYTRFLDSFEAYRLPIYAPDTIGPKETLDLLTNANEEEIVELLYLKNKRYRSEENVEYRFKKSDVDYSLQLFYKIRERFLKDREKDLANIKLIESLEKKLKNGETVYYEYITEDISKKANFNHYSLMIRWKNQLSYSQFMKKRDHKKTKELLNELDNLSVEEIRNKYFEKEVVIKDE